jgi:hypothetical protein
MKTCRLAWSSAGLVSLIVVAVSNNQACGEVTRIISSPSLADVEGSVSVTPEPGPYRVQWLFPASDFASLPASHGPLVAWNFRGDRTQTQAIDWAFSSATMWMSTTDTNSLSPVFAENRGPDHTLVHDGPFSFSILGSGPAQGPRDIADGTRLQLPFHYDPSQGNLLIEWLSLDPSLTASPILDLEPTPGMTRIAVGGPDASMANALFEGAGVSQFEFAAVPEPSAASIMGLAVVGLGTWRLRIRRPRGL